MKSSKSFNTVIKIIVGVLLAFTFLLNWLAWALNANGFPIAHSYWLNNSGQKIDVGFDADHAGLTQHNNLIVLILDFILLATAAFIVYELIVFVAKFFNKTAVSK